MEAEHGVIIQYIQTIGFPICASIAMAWALWKVGSRLLAAHFDFINAIKDQGERQTKVLENWPPDLKQICRAAEEHDHPPAKRRQT